MDAPQARELRAPGHGDGARAAGPRAVDPDHELRRRPIPTGPTATASSCRPATRRSCSTRCCYLTGLRPRARRPPAVPPVGLAARRATPRCTTRTGVEVTTGPLGQGFANGVGIGHRRAARCGPGSAPTSCDHHTFVHLQRRRPRGGHQPRGGVARRPPRLGRLVFVYDDNHITIDGPTELALSATTPAKRFEAYGWHVEQLGEVANDLDALEAALRAGDGRRGRARRSIVLRSHIGYPSPKFTDTAAAHGNPLGDDEVARTKEILGLPPDETFWVPDDVLDLYREAGPTRPATRDGVGGARSTPATATATSSTRASPAAASHGWEPKLPDVAASARRSPPARRAARASTRCSTSCPGSWAAAPTSPATPAPSSKEPRRPVADDARRPPDPLRHPRARHGRRS